MGIVTKRPKTEYVNEIDWGLLGTVVVSAIVIIAVGMFVLGLSWHITRALIRKPGPPPKVITKTVYVDQLTAEQNAFIRNCENNGDVPDVHDNPWQCLNR